MDRKKLHSEDFTKKVTNCTHGFSVPNNYFDLLEDTIMCNLAEKSLPKGNAFDVPKDYFTSVEQEILSKVELPKKEVKVVSLRKRVLQAIPAAAAACILLFIGLNYFNASENYSFDSITSDELEIWINENYSTSTQIEFIDTDFTDGNLIENETSIQDEDILDYFNTINSSSFINEIEQ
ncbi:MAG: hypothetical protein HWD85_06705 [Flavobacteriaceae bacterium]|nr:hypothetical protein [Flavobacteriaceae bacterium]